MKTVNLKKICGTFAVAVLLFVIIPINSEVNAAGGKNKDCSDAQVISFEVGSQNTMVYSDLDGKTVTGVCIKSGTNMFDDGHSQVLGSGTYENGCYTVNGIGTSTVGVLKNFDSNKCQGLSHIDIYLGSNQSNLSPTPNPHSSPSPQPTPSPISNPKVDSPTSPDNTVSSSNTSPSGQILSASIPKELPATGVGILITLLTLGTIPVGLILARYKRIKKNNP